MFAPQPTAAHCGGPSRVGMGTVLYLLQLALDETKPPLAIIILLTFPLHSSFRPVFVLTFAFRRLLSSHQTTDRSISYLTFHARFTHHQTFLPSYTMADPDVGASDAQQKKQPGAAVVQRVDDGLHPHTLDY